MSRNGTRDEGSLQVGRVRDQVERLKRAFAC
jgi:hypothetical protein